MKAHIIIRGATQRQHAIDTILMLPTDPVYEVIVREHKENLSEKQRRLMWMWHGEAANYFGTTKDSEHLDFIRGYCLPILFAEDGELSIIHDRAVDAGAEERFIRMVHTSDMTTKQVSNALSEYDMVNAAQGLVFTHPEDLYLEAMV